MRVWWDTEGLGIVPDQREAFIAYAKFILEMELREDVECFEAGQDAETGGNSIYVDFHSDWFDGLVIVSKNWHNVLCFKNVPADMEKVCKELLRQWVDASGEAKEVLMAMYGINKCFRAYLDSE